MRFRKSQWCDEAREGLRDSFGEYGPDTVREWIESGRCELWRVDGCSWLVTETFSDVLFVWQYQGKDARLLAQCLLKLAKHNGCAVVRFNTYRAGFLRMLERFDAKLVDRGDNGLLVCEMETT